MHPRVLVVTLWMVGIGRQGHHNEFGFVAQRTLSH